MRRRGGILFEVVLSLALFLAAAGLTMRCARDVIRALERAQLRQQAADVAAGAMNMLDTGLISLADLRDEYPPEELDLFTDGSVSFLDDDAPPAWTIDVATQRTEYPTLSLVQITVRRNIDGPVDPATDSTPVSFVLRQLIALSEDDPEAYELDELLDDLPMDEPMGDEEDDGGDDSDFGGGFG